LQLPWIGAQGALRSDPRWADLLRVLQLPLGGLLPNGPHEGEATAYEDSNNQDEARRLHQSGACDWVGALGSVTCKGHADRQDNRECQPDG
jgi:hypothetical protein